MKHFVNEDTERYDHKPVCCFDNENRAEKFLESKGFKCVGRHKYMSDYRRGRYDVPDMYYIKEIPYNDDNPKGYYEDEGKTYISADSYLHENIHPKILI